jgi:hypothetical protein
VPSLIESIPCGTFRIVDCQVYIPTGSYETTYSGLITARNNTSTTSDTVRLYLTVLLSSIEEKELNTNLPLVFSLNKNLPNPFISQTDIQYSIPIKTNVNITVFDPTGQKIITLFNNTQNPGWYSVRWNGKDSKGKICPNGIYFYRLETDEYQATRKMLMLR